MIELICNFCNKTFSIKQSDINRGRGKYCSRACFGKAHSSSKNPAYKHGNSNRKTGQTKEYRTWAGIKQRVSNPHTENGHYYQVKGIKMCDRWLNSFENFLEDMGKAPSSQHTIDRINNDGDYEPSNCRWATHKEQMWNTRATKLLTHNGKTLPQEEWGRITRLGGLTILKRLKRGWTIEQALTLPKGSKISTGGK